MAEPILFFREEIKEKREEWRAGCLERTLDPLSLRDVSLTGSARTRLLMHNS